MLCIGIDISKARFDGAVCVEGVDHNPSFAHDHRGFKRFVQMAKIIGRSARETVQETLDRHAMWKTQPPKSPLSGGLVTQFPPDKGGKGG